MQMKKNSIVFTAIQLRYEEKTTVYGLGNSGSETGLWSLMVLKLVGNGEEEDEGVEEVSAGRRIKVDR